VNDKLIVAYTRRFRNTEKVTGTQCTGNIESKGTKNTTRIWYASSSSHDFLDCQRVELSVKWSSVLAASRTMPMLL
jgi:hypothetical protein